MFDVKVSRPVHTLPSQAALASVLAFYRRKLGDVELVQEDEHFYIRRKTRRGMPAPGRGAAGHVAPPITLQSNSGRNSYPR